MNLFNDDNKDPFADQAPIPDGKYSGKIEKTDVFTTKDGHKGVKLEIRLQNNRMVFERLNFEHPKTKEISVTSLKKILHAALTAPPKTLTTTKEIADMLKGLPVYIQVKQKGEDDKGYMKYGLYFQKLPDPALKVTKGAAPAGGVNY